jgi:hypothetical protein
VRRPVARPHGRRSRGPRNAIERERDVLPVRQWWRVCACTGAGHDVGDGATNAVMQGRMCTPGDLYAAAASKRSSVEVLCSGSCVGHAGRDVLDGVCRRSRR